MDTHVSHDGPDTHEMVVIHRTFRQGFAELADAARRVSPGDTARADAVARYVELMLNTLAKSQMLDVTTPDVAVSFLRTLPLPVRLIWRLAGRPRYRLHMRLVSGSAR